MLQQYFVCLRFGFITTDFSRCWSWLSLALQLLLQSPGSLTAFRTWTSMVTSTHTSRRGSNRTTLTRTTTTTTTRSTTIRSHRNRCRASLSLSYVFLSRSALFCSPLWLSFSPTRAFSLCHALFTVFSIYLSLYLMTQPLQRLAQPLQLQRSPEPPQVRFSACIRHIIVLCCCLPLLPALTHVLQQPHRRVVYPPQTEPSFRVMYDSVASYPLLSGSYYFQAERS
jgi:hypothetical protein